MRAFVAIDVQDGGVLQAIHDVQNGLELDARPVAARNMHFTLQFLGEVPQDGVPGVISALKAVTFPPFELEISGIGAFPRPSAPRIVWIGTDQEGGEAMKRLAEGVEDALRPLGFAQHKAFVPHLTIFRIKNKVGDITGGLNRFDGIKFGRITVSQMKLKQSTLASSGPIYSDLGVIDAE